MFDLFQDSLMLAPTKRYFGLGDQNDYCVLDDGHVIGRIFMARAMPSMSVLWS